MTIMRHFESTKTHLLRGATRLLRRGALLGGGAMLLQTTGCGVDQLIASLAITVGQQLINSFVFGAFNVPI